MGAGGLLLFGFAGTLLLCLVAMTVSFFVAGYFNPYWRRADMDYMMTYQVFLLNDGRPQSYFDHPGYLKILLFDWWARLFHGLGALDVIALSKIPPASDVAGFERAWTAAVRTGRLLVADADAVVRDGIRAPDPAAGRRLARRRAGGGRARVLGRADVSRARAAHRDAGGGLRYARPVAAHARGAIAGVILALPDGRCRRHAVHARRHQQGARGVCRGRLAAGHPCIRRAGGRAAGAVAAAGQWPPSCWRSCQRCSCWRRSRP